MSRCLFDKCLSFNRKFVRSTRSRKYSNNSDACTNATRYLTRVYILYVYCIFSYVYTYAFVCIDIFCEVNAGILFSECRCETQSNKTFTLQDYSIVIRRFRYPSRHEIHHRKKTKCCSLAKALFAEESARSFSLVLPLFIVTSL